MSLETVSFPDDLVITNPVATDLRSEGDDHLRNIKTAIKAAFPGLAGRAWRSQTKNTGYTVIATDNMTLLNCTAALTLALTAVATLANGHITLVWANGGAILIDPDAAETVNGAASVSIPNGCLGILHGNGAAWVCAIIDISSNVKQTLTDAATIAWNTSLGKIAAVTLGANRTMEAPTNLALGTLILEVIQDATGSRLITWNSVFKWDSGVAPVLSTAANAKDILSFYCDGTNLHGGIFVRGSA